MSGWAEIPSHILELIAEKGTSFEDIVTLGLICKWWRDVAVACKENFMKKQLPWLMLPPKKGSHLRGFYSLTTGRRHQIPLWESDGKKCYSSRGWLLTVGSDWGINLLHPITLARFKLPGIKSFGEPRYGFSKPYVRFMGRAILSESPSLASNFVLMVIQACPSMPAYWRPGDKRWTLIETTGIAFADAVFFQDKCYFITFCRKLLVADFRKSNPTTAEFITEFSEELIKGDLFEVFYLVILEGSLLLVSRQVSQCFGRGKKFQDYQTIYFQVFKLDFKSLGWKELKSLGKWSLFLGQNSSMALNASDKEGEPNSIYFIDDDKDFSRGTKKGAGYDMGIFNMTHKTIKPLIEGELHNRVSPLMFVEFTF